MPKKISEIQAFAERVERVCDFLLDQTPRDGSEDRKVLEDLKNEAANLQFSDLTILYADLDGLSSFMKGAYMAPDREK